MTTVERADRVARDTILKNVVGRGERQSQHVGEEYVDLEHLEAGVQIAKASMTKALTGHIVPRSAVHSATWSKIVAQLTH